MKYFPESAPEQLELGKVGELLGAYCRSAWAREKAAALRIYTERSAIETALGQALEFKTLLVHGQSFPNDHVLNLAAELRLLGLPGATLNEEQFLQIRRLADATRQFFHWFDAQRRIDWPSLAAVIAHSRYDKEVIARIDEILDETGLVRDRASEELARIRAALFRKRGELRRLFDRILQKLNKAGYAADYGESFLNGRRVVAVFAEQKRQVKGILHGESETRKTAFIEPEETIGLNNEVFSLEHEESREVQRILRALTGRLAAFAPLLVEWHAICGDYDFIEARAKLAVDMDAHFPSLSDQPVVDLREARHPLLLLYNRRQNKPVVPVSLRLDDRNRILVISGPNAGGKTVAMKTVGLLQLMLQAGLLVPVHPDSTMGIFKQLLIHIGDTQSIEFELSTYSSHLLHMKYFMEHAGGKTMFFIDELGSGSDPSLGGAFAEVILEELVRKHAVGIVTTHYLNLKVMASRTPGIVNGAMAFDEKTLQPQYRLLVGKPGSSYTFSIAERIGLPQRLIDRARALVDGDHFRLDKLLNRTEQDLRGLEKREAAVKKLQTENEALQKEMEKTLDQEKHRQQVELQREQNRVAIERIAYLRDMERKLRQLVTDWRKTDDKQEVVKQMQALLFNQPAKAAPEKARRKIEAKYREVPGEIAAGQKVVLKKNHQVGIVRELRGRKAVVQIGLVPITVELADLALVADKPAEETPPAPAKIQKETQA